METRKDEKRRDLLQTQMAVKGQICTLESHLDNIDKEANELMDRMSYYRLVSWWEITVGFALIFTCAGLYFFGPKGFWGILLFILLIIFTLGWLSSIRLFQILYYQDRLIYVSTSSPGLERRYDGLCEREEHFKNELRERKTQLYGIDSQLKKLDQQDGA